MTSDEAIGRHVPLSVGRPGDSAPRGWTWKRLGDLAKLESGHTPSRARLDWWGGDIPWIALPDIRLLDGRVAMATIETTNAEGIRHSAARVLPAGTVVMSRTASVGFVTRMGRPMATSQDFVNWVCGPNLDSEFLMYLFIRAREFVRSLSSGAIHKTVYFPTVQQFWVCVPSIEEQLRIASDLRKQLDVAAIARVAADEQFQLAGRLSSAILARAFERERDKPTAGRSLPNSNRPNAEPR